MKRREALKKSILVAGTSVAAPTLLALLQSCKSEERLNWTPKFFDEGGARFISSFVDTLLPKTETPGGLDVKTDIFIDLFYSQVLDQDAQKGVLHEVSKFNISCEERYGAVFSELSSVNRTEVFKTEETSNEKYNPGVWGTAVGEQKPVGFYRSLKSLALWAYFSSEEVGKNLLSYDPIPGEYNGCVLVNEVGNTWSLGFG